MEGAHIPVRRLAHQGEGGVLRNWVATRHGRGVGVVGGIGVHYVATTFHRVSRGDIDGVSLVAGLHIDGDGEAAYATAQAAGHIKHHLADIAFALGGGIFPLAVEGELHVQHSGTTAVEGTYQQAL